MLSRHAPTTGSDAACTCQIRHIGVLRCSHGIQLQLLVRCGQRGGTPPIPTIPLLCKFAARIRSGWRSTKPTSWGGSTGRRTLHPCNFHEDCKQPHDQDKQTWSTRTSSLKWTKKHGWRIIHVAGHACELIALQTSLIYVYALQMSTPCSSTRTGKRSSRRSQADSSCAFIMFMYISILAGWLHQNNSNEWAEGSLRLEVEEEARDLEFISDCKQNWFLLRPHRTSRKSPIKRHGLKSASAT